MLSTLKVVKDFIALPNGLTWILYVSVGVGPSSYLLNPLRTFNPITPP